VTRRYVAQMIAVHRAEPEVHHALEREGRPVLIGEWERQAMQIVRAYLEQHRDELAIADLDLAAFLVSVTTEAITHAAVLERPDLLKDDRLVDGIVAMLLGYLTARAQ
jgi:hypothetical protein